ncbi:MAG: hypothetical protein Fur0037_28420 [Planctomycetota bacterium]
MVDVSEKPPTRREAVAEALVRLTPSVRDRLFQGDLPKGEALAAARVAGIQAAKETSRLIPLCHPLPLSSATLDFEPVEADAVRVRATARAFASTGVEMEALTAVSVAALTIYDMVKALCRGAAVERIVLLRKSGGESGTWERAD